MSKYGSFFRNIFSNIDIVSFLSALFLSLAGLSIIFSVGDDNSAFIKQSTSLSIAILIFFIVSRWDIYFLKNSNFIYSLYFLSILLFLSLIVFATPLSGATSWFSFNFFTFQPTDFAKIILVLLLAKYFFKRHIEIYRIKHLFISGIYAFNFVILLAMQPDLGSAMIMFFIWFGFVMVAGIPKKYIFGLLSFVFGIFLILYNFFLQTYQVSRIDTFLNPQSDTLGSGYNIIQANIALGSGGLFGRGVLEGTQSRLFFLPEADTDFIFSAFGEEWGLVGIIILFIVFLILMYRIVDMATRGRTNFESLFISGIAIYFFTHFFVHVGINLGIMPVTGTTMPFMSYGGSHLVMEFFALGLVNAISKTNRSFNRRELRETDIIG